MTSDRQLAANRVNAKRSTGPRSKVGLRRSSRNAFRHGLAIGIGSDPSFSDEIQRLARAILPEGSSQRSEALAHHVAEAEIDLLRIRRIRASLIKSALGAPGPESGRFSALNENLSKIERYERRAFSRRKRAIRVMIDAGRTAETYSIDSCIK